MTFGYSPKSERLTGGVSELGGTSNGTGAGVINNQNLINACSEYIGSRSNDSLLACLDAAVDFLLRIYLKNEGEKARLLRWACGNGVNDYMGMLVSSSIQLFCYNQDIRPDMPKTEEMESVINIDHYKEQLGILIREWSMNSEGLIPITDRDN